MFLIGQAKAASDWLGSRGGSSSAGANWRPELGSTTKFGATKYKPSKWMMKWQNKFKPESALTGTTGGQETTRLLTGTLQAERNKARLSGRALTEGTAEGLSRGYFSGATDRLAQSKALTLQERGQDISGALGFAGIRSAEKLATMRLRSAEAMFRAGLISAEELEREKMMTSIEVAELGAKEQERATESSGGLFGGGGVLGLGF